MGQTSREMMLQRIEQGLVRLHRAIRSLPDQRATGIPADAVSREAHEALLAAHNLLRTHAEAAVAGIDRLLNRTESSDV